MTNDPETTIPRIDTKFEEHDAMDATITLTISGLDDSGEIPPEILAKVIAASKNAAPYSLATGRRRIDLRKKETDVTARDRKRLHDAEDVLEEIEKSLQTVLPEQEHMILELVDRCFLASSLLTADFLREKYLTDMARERAQQSSRKTGGTERAKIYRAETMKLVKFMDEYRNRHPDRSVLAAATEATRRGYGAQHKDKSDDKNVKANRSRYIRAKRATK